MQIGKQLRRLLDEQEKKIKKREIKGILKKTRENMKKWQQDRKPIRVEKQNKIWNKWFR